MQPVAYEFFSGDPFRLRDLGFVMRENVIHAAAMNIDLIAEQRRRHGAAFDVPARTASAPWAFPADIAIFFIPRLPQCKVSNVFLVVLVVLHPAGRLQLREIEMGELSVTGKFVDAEIN